MPQNTFTAEAMLLLESTPSSNRSLYEIIGLVIDAYWRDYDGHRRISDQRSYQRYFAFVRTFCVNYEARTSTNQQIKRRNGS